MNAMLDPSTHAANTHVCRRFAQGVALTVERMISSSHGRACRPFMLDAPVSFKASPVWRLPLASRDQPLIPLIADQVCEQHIHQRPASVSATGHDVGHEFD